MNLLDIFAVIVLICLVLSAVIVFVLLGMLPGSIARKRNHPCAQAVSLAGWLTLIFGFVFWPLAMIWAYVDVPRPALPAAELDNLRRRVSVLENAVHLREAAE